MILHKGVGVGVTQEMFLCLYVGLGCKFASLVPPGSVWQMDSLLQGIHLPTEGRRNIPLGQFCTFFFEFLVLALQDHSCPY